MGFVNNRFRRPIHTGLILVLISLGGGRAAGAGLDWGIWIGTRIPRDGFAARELVNRCAENGIHMLFPHTPFIEEDPEFWKGVLVPLIDQCRLRGLEVHLWIDPIKLASIDGRHDLMQVDEHGKETVLACPANPEVLRLNIDKFVRIVREHPVDGIHLEDCLIWRAKKNADVCYCAYCRKHAPIGKSEWTRWRVAKLNEFVHKLREAIKRENPRIRLSYAARMPYASSMGMYTDWVEWCRSGELDFVVPMCYRNATDDFRRLADDAAGAMKGIEVPVYLGLGMDSSMSHLAPGELTRQVSATRSRPIQGVVLFHYQGMDENQWGELASLRGIKGVEPQRREPAPILRAGLPPVSMLPAPRRCELTGRAAGGPLNKVAIVTGQYPCSQEAYAADLIRGEISRRGNLELPVIKERSSLEEYELVIVLGTRASNRLLNRICLRRQFPLCESYPGQDGFLIRCCEYKDKDVVMLGGWDGPGVIYAAHLFLELVSCRDGRMLLPETAIDDWPSVKFRGQDEKYHRLGSGYNRVDDPWLGKVAPIGLREPQVYRYYLDWLARFRSNCVTYQTSKLDAVPEHFSDFVQEAHRRGIKVFGGVRYIGSWDERAYICYSDPNDVSRVLSSYEDFLRAGCDGLIYLADDVAADRKTGHCPRCREMFGGLAGEQIFLLKKAVALAKKYNLPADRVWFCPTYYHDYPTGETAKEQASRAYYQAFARQEELRGIRVFGTYCAEPAITSFQADTGLDYVWWYNGPRWINYFFRKQVDKKADAVFYPLFYGWHGYKWDAAKGIVKDAGVDNTFKRIAQLTGGFWHCCGDPGIRHNELCDAQWGLFAWNPGDFDNGRAERHILGYLYGPSNYETLKRLNDACIALLGVYMIPAADLPKDYAERLAQARADLEALKAGYAAYQKPFADPKLPDFYIQKSLERYAVSLDVMEAFHQDKVVGARK